MVFDRIFLKFLLAGLANTITGSGLMFVMYNVFGMGYWISSAVNYIVGSIISFFLNKYWTFNVSKWSLYMVFAFIVTIVISWFLAYKIAKIVLSFFFFFHSKKTLDNISLFVGMCLFTGLNYIGQRFIVFRK
jgi:putative flippase GtrA